MGIIASKNIAAKQNFCLGIVGHKAAGSMGVRGADKDKAPATGKPKLKPQIFDALLGEAEE